jgi:hypothetical protein
MQGLGKKVWVLAWVQAQAGSASDSVIHSGPNLPQSVGGGVLRNRENRHHCRTTTVAYSSQNIPFSVYAVASIPH